ncbi:hypothetical protein EZV62_017263 [Acer yangbiense]|uniref:Uncharacterized protein n=1 Tax=Acer yangbiense TaxID=1000413 RepID=A0A5C7HFX8_9ROSI|nr:hypothetical protein EZV62_017263 [Acer yangbiense]
MAQQIIGNLDENPGMGNQHGAKETGKMMHSEEKEKRSFFERCDFLFLGSLEEAVGLLVTCPDTSPMTLCLLDTSLISDDVDGKFITDSLMCLISPIDVATAHQADMTEIVNTK